MNITFLGTGTSHGVPSIDCMMDNHKHCKKGVCAASESDPVHRRSRSSLFVEYQGRRILLDASMDFRAQALAARIPDIDAVLITHRHSDHIGGIPDIRSYNRYGKKVIPVFGSSESLDSLCSTYDYIFSPTTFPGGGIPQITINPVDGPFDCFGVTVTPIPVFHGNLFGCFGYRIGPLAYIPDMRALTEESLELLNGVRCLILNCLRDDRAHSTHLILGESIMLARAIAPEKCYFIHLCHDIHYQLDAGRLEPWMQFAHDGLFVTIED